VKIFSRLIGACLGFALLVASACTVGDPASEDYADDPGADEGELPGEAQRRSDLSPGDIATLGLANVTVPAAGMGVFTEVVTEDGSLETLTLETDDDGVVWEHLGPERLATDDDAALQASPNPCSDGAHSLMPHTFAQRLNWRFNAGTTPSNLSAGAVEDALIRATANITRSRNNCGLADNVSATHRYRGRTSRGMNITAAGGCRNSNGESGVGFGSLPNGVLGVACTWYFADGSAVESDVRLNRGDRWYVNRPASCSNRFDIESVMTHERGHSFGLGHVAEGTHGKLTMSTAIRPCDNSGRTLGLGDVRGLRKKY